MLIKNVKNYFQRRCRRHTVTTWAQPHQLADILYTFLCLDLQNYNPFDSKYLTNSEVKLRPVVLD